MTARISRWATGAVVGAVAAITGTISYTHIYDLTRALHQSALTACLMPVAIDGLIIVGSVVLLKSGSRLGWLGVGPGLALSVFANVESGIRFGWLSAVWAGIPALSFFLATFIFERWLRSQAAAVSMDVPGSVPGPVTGETAEDVPGITVETIETVPASTVLPAREARSRTVAARPGPARIDARRKADPVKVFAAELAAGQLPSLREIKVRAHCGTDKARAIRAELAELTSAPRAA